MEYIYAELDDDGRVKALRRGSTAMDLPTMIRIAVYDESLLGALHTGTDGSGFGIFDGDE